jgi:hypothetical protein
MINKLERVWHRQKAKHWVVGAPLNRTSPFLKAIFLETSSDSQYIFLTSLLFVTYELNVK